MKSSSQSSAQWGKEMVRAKARMRELERRVAALEERTREALWREAVCVNREAAYTARYGEFVDKTVAANLLGVTRTTVYAMLADGRICAACGGRKVDVRSIVRYLSSTGDARRARGESGVSA